MSGGEWWWVVSGGGWWVVGTHGNPTHGNSTNQKLTRWQDMMTSCRYRRPTVYEPAHIQPIEDTVVGQGEWKKNFAF